MTAQELVKFLQILPESTDIYFGDECITICVDFDGSSYDINDCGDVVFFDWKHHTYKIIGNFLDDFDAVKQCLILPYFVFGSCKTT
jgi:hypothetical protein